MARILWLNWSGGGNLPPSLGIARALAERGHGVAFAGRPEMVPRVEAAGFRAITFTAAYAQLERYPTGGPMRNAACYLTSPAVAEEANSITAAEAPDIVLIDGMFPAALSQAAHFPCPTVAISHTFVFRQLDAWRAQIGRLNGLREQAGFSALPGLDALWQAQDRIIVTALAAFDLPRPSGWPSVHHAGPVLEDEKVAVPCALPWDDSNARPVILVSFSTSFEQRSLQKFQHTLDALAELPVSVVATLGGVVQATELSVPANAIAFDYAAHDPILRRAALVVSHGGHGTAMRALRHGVPMILMPGLAHDQAPIAATMQEWGAGVALPGDAGAVAIREAARTILSTPSYRDNAMSRAGALAGVDGAANAADEIEALLAKKAPAPGQYAGRPQQQCQQVA
jgi:MGT family glycosyltransferase